MRLRKAAGALLLLWPGLWGTDACGEEKLKIDVVKVTYLNADTLVKGRSDSVYDIDLGPDGKVYVPEYRRDRISIFDADLTLLKTIENVPSPHGLAVDRKGFIYVATYGNGRVLKFDPAGQEVPDWDKELRARGLVQSPVAMDTDESDNLYIADYGTKTIVKTDEGGKVLVVFDQAKVPGGEMLPHGIVVDGRGVIYVADRQGEKGVRVFTLDGQYRGMWTLPQKPLDPLAVRFFGTENLLVPNYKSGVIEIFNTQGDHVASTGSFGSQSGQFLYAMNAAGDGKGHAYIVEQDGNRVQKLRIRDHSP